MNSKTKLWFLILVLIQVAHSTEEYFGKLWEVFPPATYLTSLFSDNLEIGFLRVNIGLFIFGMLCWAIPIRGNYTAAKYIVWFWIILELINGLVHSAWSLYQQSYTPGLITAPFLFITAIYLTRTVNQSKKTLH